MDLRFPDEQRAVEEPSRAFVHRELVPPEDEVERTGRVDPDLVRELRADGVRRHLLRSATRHASRLAATGAAGRNFRRWPVLGVRVWPNPPASVRRTSYKSEVDALRSWLERRIRWMDRHVQHLGRSA